MNNKATSAAAVLLLEPGHSTHTSWAACCPDTVLCYPRGILSEKMSLTPLPTEATIEH
jgi:hypothetical protein